MLADHQREMQQLARRSAQDAINQHILQLQTRILANDYPRCCFVCGEVFSTFVRQHHCRACGLLCCDTCSQHRIAMTHAHIANGVDAFDHAGNGCSPLSKASTRHVAASKSAFEDAGAQDEESAGTDPFSDPRSGGAPALSPTGAGSLRVCNLCFGSEAWVPEQ